MLLWQAAAPLGGQPQRPRAWESPAGGNTNSELLVSSEYYILIVKTFNNGSLGSGIDEERSEMR
jgi:hypothetical protein